jgi:hypothetical protein
VEGSGAELHAKSKDASIVKELEVGSCQVEDPLSCCHPTLDQTIAAEAVEPVDHWVYDAVAAGAAGAVESTRLGAKVAVDHILDLGRTAVEALAGLQG